MRRGRLTANVRVTDGTKDRIILATERAEQLIVGEAKLVLASFLK
jgi:hypothetical protein